MVAGHDYISNYPIPAKNWFAILTVQRHEKRVEEHFRARGIESFLPLRQMRCQWKNRSRRILRFPLFPTYIFARIDRYGRVPVLAVPGVRFVVGGGREGTSVPDSYIHFLRQGLQEGRIESYPYITEGTKVRIRCGAMAGWEGILLREKNNLRVVLALEVIMKSVTVEVSIHDIEEVVDMNPSYLLQYKRRTPGCAGEAA
jgi:transcription antitermination factor NusG